MTGMGDPRVRIVPMRHVTALCLILDPILRRPCAKTRHREQN